MTSIYLVTLKFCLSNKKKITLEKLQSINDQCLGKTLSQNQLLFSHLRHQFSLSKITRNPET